jgi:hypothetical protein
MRPDVVVVVASFNELLRWLKPGPSCETGRQSYDLREESPELLSSAVDACRPCDIGPPALPECPPCACGCTCDTAPEPTSSACPVPPAAAPEEAAVWGTVVLC